MNSRYFLDTPCINSRYLYEMNIKEQEVQPAGEYHLAGVHLGKFFYLAEVFI